MQSEYAFAWLYDCVCVSVLCCWICVCVCVCVCVCFIGKNGFKECVCVDKLWWISVRLFTTLQPSPFFPLSRVTAATCSPRTIQTMTSTAATAHRSSPVPGGVSFWFDLIWSIDWLFFFPFSLVLIFLCSISPNRHGMPWKSPQRRLLRRLSHAICLGCQLVRQRHRHWQHLLGRLPLQ